MKMNFTKLMLISVMMTTTIMVMSSNTILFSWMSMEINLISFMPILTKSKKMNDQPMKYFIVQSMSSSMMLMSILINSNNESPLDLSIMLMTSMLMKMGMMPFHLWLPALMQSMSWETCFMFSTWQKLSPVILLTQVTKIEMMLMPMTISLMFSPISAIKQLSIKKIMAYSSISNSPWMIMSMMISKMQFLMFMSIYSTMTMIFMKKMKKMNIFYVNQISMASSMSKTSMILLMLSISGMPPLLGFLPKWIIIQNTILVSINLSMFMIVSSMMSTFIYLKMMSPLTMNSMTKKINKKEKKMNKNDMIINMMGLPMMMILKMA